MLSKADQAKYPVLPDAVEYVRQRGLTIEELSDQSYATILDRAEERLKEAIAKGIVSSEWQNDDVEILSFPVAVYLTTILRDDWVRRRFALAESRRTSQFLLNEDIGRVAEIATKTFGWKIDPAGVEVSEVAPILRVDFKSYIKNALKIREFKWKLTNRVLDHGFVRVSKDEATRLLQEEVQSRILSRVKSIPMEQPSFLKDRVERLRKLVSERRATAAFSELPETVVPAAMPPCMRNLYDSMHSGKHIPHIGRFALTSFLVNAGVNQEGILLLFKTAADFDEKKTRYQVEHIAGARGGKTKYKPPKCATLRTHGLCITPDDLCRQISHPISYYRTRLRKVFPRGRRYAEKR